MLRNEGFEIVVRKDDPHCCTLHARRDRQDQRPGDAHVAATTTIE